MDILTQSLVAAALSRAFFKGRVAYATTAMVVAVNLPDIDLLYSWPGINYLKYHRGLLTSVFALPLLALAIALGLRWWCRRRGVAGPALWMGFLLGATGVAAHNLLDWTTAYGFRPWAPFNENWYALSWMPGYDPWVWLLLAAFLGFPMLLGLILTEVRIGAARKANTHAVSALLALLLVVGYIFLRGRQHAAALSLLNSPSISGMYDGQMPLDWECYPNTADPNQWQAVINLPNNYLMAAVTTTWDTQYGAVNLQRNYIKPPRDGAIAAAEATSTAEAFLWFARFPLTDDQSDDDNTLVTMTDLRYGHGQTRPDMHAQVRLDGSQHVISQFFTWSRR